MEVSKTNLAPSIGRDWSTIVASEATRALARRDKAPAMEAPTPLEVQGASKSFRADPRSVGQHLTKREAYVMVDGLKNFMSTVTDTFMQQVSE